MATLPLKTLIGYQASGRPFESFHIYIARLIYANFLDEKEVHRQIPAEWLQLAFFPQSASEALARAAEHACPGFPKLKLPQVSASAWQPFPALESQSGEYMRSCPVCLWGGHHSYAYQTTLIKQCPVHHVALVDRCQHCGTPTPWKGHLLYSRSALRCPQGCSISGQYLKGLLNPSLDLVTALKLQLQWVHNVRRSAQFDVGPIYIDYPPSHKIEGTNPSVGLGAAACDALRQHSRTMPKFRDLHDRSHGQWECLLKPWNLKKTAPWINHENRGALVASFQRGPYVTEIPIPKTAYMQQVLNALESGSSFTQHGFHELCHGNVALLSTPSYLLTNSEVSALYQVLSFPFTDANVEAFYEQLLAELLEVAYERRDALDKQQEMPCLNLAERTDGIVRVGECTYRFIGRCMGSGDGLRAWNSFSEQTVQNPGIIWFARASSIFGN